MGFCYSMYLTMFKYQNPILGSDPMMGFRYNMYLTVFMNWDSNLGSCYNPILGSDPMIGFCYNMLQRYLTVQISEPHIKVAPNDGVLLHHISNSIYELGLHFGVQRPILRLNPMLGFCYTMYLTVYKYQDPIMELYPIMEFC